jgi:Lrp/AsnC family leucine-responsive transcriptional regulator
MRFQQEDINMTAPLDEVDRRLLRELHQDSRLTIAELGRRASLSRPATAARLRRLEESGVIKAYTIQVDPAKLGFPLLAVVRIRTMDPTGRALAPILDTLPEVVECRRLTGEDCIATLVWARSVEHLEQITQRLASAGHTITAVVFSTWFDNRLPLTPPSHPPGGGGFGTDR